MRVIAVVGYSEKHINSVVQKVRDTLQVHDVLEVSVEKDFEYMVERLQHNAYKEGGKDMIIIGSPAKYITQRIVGNMYYSETDWILKEADMLEKYNRLITHQVIIPEAEGVSYFGQQAILEAVLKTIVGQRPTIVLPHQSKEDNWRLITSFLTGIELAR
jgi:hypothetical protein